MYLGSGDPTGANLLGDLDEFRVYNRALTQTEITELYDQ
jgi:Concanavalin A-like lectin/glucanases superfamily